jgi:L-aspartate oxidase
MTPEMIGSRFPNIHETCSRYGLDIIKDRIPVAPAAHYMMGGVATDLWGCSSVPGLFACGEVACTGVHGANRLASNSLLEDLVFAYRIAGLLGHAMYPMPKADALAPAPRPNVPANTAPVQGILELQKLMTAHAGITRAGEGLEQALTRLKAMRVAPVPAASAPELHEWGAMHLAAGLILQAAFLRTESRGCHFRVDFPHPDSDWERRLYFSRGEEYAGVVVG